MPALMVAGVDMTVRVVVVFVTVIVVQVEGFTFLFVVECVL